MRGELFHLVIYAAVLASLATPALAQSRIDCNVMNSSILHDAVHYCVLIPPGYDAASKAPSARYPILYFLHGLGENEQTMFKTGGWTLLDDFRQQHKIGNFLIVTPEAKASFYVNSADGKVRYDDFFLREFIPHIESLYHVPRERGARAITGISMGGYGALHFAFAHPDTFSAVSAQSAALMTESPQELNAAARSGTPLGRLLGSVFGTPINIQHWHDNDPLFLARKNRAALGRLAINFNCGREDNFDFEVGAEALHRLLQAENIRHEFHLYAGDHSPRYFMVHLGEILQFHSDRFRSSTGP